VNYGILIGSGRIDGVQTIKPMDQRVNTFAAFFKAI
jgi:hypothetical protein